MSKPNSKYQTAQDWPVAIATGVMGEALIDCARLGASRQYNQDQFGRDWPRRSKSWNSLRRMIAWLHSWQFANMAEVLDIDDDILRAQLLRWTAGIASGSVSWQ